MGAGFEGGNKRYFIPRIVINYLNSKKLTQSLIMAFTFLRSYQPDTEHPDDEEEDEMPMARSGSVRAFSHLPEPEADDAQPQRSSRSLGRDPGDDAQPPPPPQSLGRDPDDEAQPPPPSRSLGRDPDAEAQPPPPSRSLGRDPGDDAQPPEEWEKPTRDSGFEPAAPTTPRTSGLMMRPRPMPPEYARRQARGRLANSTPYGDERAATEADAHLYPGPDARAAFDARAARAVDDESVHQGPFQKPARAEAGRQLLARTGTGARPTPSQPMITPGKTPSPLDPSGGSKPKPAPAPAPDPGRDTPPGQGQGKPATPPPPSAPPPPLKVHDADDTEEDAQGRTFGDTVRSIMRAELAGSPTAAALLKRASALSKKQVIIKMTTKGEAYTEIGPDGSITVYVNPEKLKIGTLSHEISHAIQGWHLEQAKKKKMAETGKESLSPDEMKAAKKAGRTELHSVVKVAVREDGLDDSTEYRENEGVRSANVVTAEITAAETRAEIEALKQTDPKRYESLIKDPMAVAKMFWENQRKKEGVGHEKNQRPIPKGTRYGLYDFAPVLKSLGYGVTQEHLKQWRQKNMSGN
jgi:hypothetical protein